MAVVESNHFRSRSGGLLSVAQSKAHLPTLMFLTLMLLFCLGGASWIPYLISILIPHSEQLLAAHALENFSVISVRSNQFQFGWQHVQLGLPLWIGALFALVLTFKGRLVFRRVAFPFAVLLVLSLVAAFHSPWWDYYLLDFWPCLAWLAGEALVWTLCWIQNRRKYPLSSDLRRLSLAVFFEYEKPSMIENGL